IAMIRPVFLEPVGEPAEHLEAAGLHPLDHLHDPRLDAGAALFVRRVLGQHVDAVRAHGRGSFVLASAGKCEMTGSELRTVTRGRDPRVVASRERAATCRHAPETQAGPDALSANS